jgi:predicted RNase H-like nuclease (RuvC/YqgF family)|tara:strand:- start:63 stop:521 length:459 start_codon:yes stop_codon:yes gene_type:complete
LDRKRFLVPDQTEIKVDIESLKKDIENINNIQGRLDTAIDKLTDVSTSIKSMLAVHEEKIQRQEQVDDIIFRKLKERDSEVDDIFRDLQREMDQVEKRLLNEIRSLRNDIGGRVGVLEKYRWIILGGFLAIGWVLSKNFKFIMGMMSGTGLN